MRNEILARAISDLDDDLIEEALQAPIKLHRKRTILAACAAAACLLLICSSVFLSRSAVKFSISAYGYAVTEGGVPVEAAPEASEAARAMQDILSVPLEIAGKGKIEIRAIDGTAAVSSQKNNQLLYSGESCSVQTPVTIWWNIPQPDKTQTYRLALWQDTELSLSYDESTEQWMINKAIVVSTQ